MKKTIALILALITILATCVFMVSCGKTGECEECGETAKLSKVTFDGESEWVCPDCKEIIDALSELADYFG